MHPVHRARAVGFVSRRVPRCNSGPLTASDRRWQLRLGCTARHEGLHHVARPERHRATRRLHEALLQAGVGRDIVDPRRLDADADGQSSGGLVSIHDPLARKVARPPSVVATPHRPRLACRSCCRLARPNTIVRARFRIVPCPSPPIAKTSASSRPPTSRRTWPLTSMSSFSPITRTSRRSTRFAPARPTCSSSGPSPGWPQPSSCGRASSSWYSG